MGGLLVHWDMLTMDEYWSTALERWYETNGGHSSKIF